VSSPPRSSVTAPHDRIRCRLDHIFARIGRLSLLHEVSGSLLIPDAVYDEVVVKKGGMPRATEVAQAAWIQKTSVANRSIIDGLPNVPHEGEREAIALTRSEARGCWLTKFAPDAARAIWKST
jgi:predicted nucleic acid-binding protein